MAKVDTIHIAISRPDGGVSIMCFVTKQYGSTEGGGWENPATPDNIEAVLNKRNKPWTTWRIMAPSEVQNDITDRTFRNAWKDDNGIGVNMQKAREIHRNNLRGMRATVLAQLDTEFMRALEAGDTAKQTEIAARKQVLRDVTERPEIEEAQTPEQLKHAWPSQFI
jgi:hypothetical protein